MGGGGYKYGGGGLIARWSGGMGCDGIFDIGCGGWFFGDFCSLGLD